MYYILIKSPFENLENDFQKVIFSVELAINGKLIQ